jgi:hypothetical protein
MKWLYIGIGILVGGPILFFAAIYAASELGGEVVVLHRQSADGSIDRIRIWVVDDGERTWIEHGAPDADWISMLADDPMIILERRGEATRYHASADPEAHARYHALREAKYGFADQFVAIAGGDGNACSGVPVEIRTIP